MVVVVGFEVVVNALVKVAGAANNQVNSLSHRFHDIGVRITPTKFAFENYLTQHQFFSRVVPWKLVFSLKYSRFTHCLARWSSAESCLFPPSQAVSESTFFE